MKEDGMEVACIVLTEEKIIQSSSKGTSQI
jgi:hypothetical protein